MKSSHVILGVRIGRPAGGNGGCIARERGLGLKRVETGHGI